MKEWILPSVLVFCLAFPACQKKAGPSIAPANPTPEQVQRYQDASAKDEAYQKKIRTPEGLQSLNPEERARYNRETTDALFFDITRDRDARMFQAISDLDPNMGVNPFDPNARSKAGDTFLTASVKAGSRPAVEFFLKKGTDPSLKDSDGKTPLELARGMKRDDLVVALSKSK